MFPRLEILKRFSRDQRGNVAMMFGLAALPMVAAAGTAIDYGRVSSSQSKIHAALDSAALAVAKEPFVSLALTQSKIQTFFAANLYDKNLITTPTVVVKPTTSDKVLVEVTGCVKMAFAGVTGLIDPCVKASSEVTRGGSVKLEIALAMDNSGSMLDSDSGKSKMDALKESAQNFVNTMMASPATPDQVKISLVPFTHSVNTGLSRTSPGVDSTGLSPIHWENLLNAGDTKPPTVTSRFTLFDQLGDTWGGCMETRPGAYALNDDAPSLTLPASLYVPYFAPDDPGNKSTALITKSLLNEQSASGSNSYSVPNSYLNDDGGSANVINGSGVETSTTNPACSSGSLAAIFNHQYTPSTSDWQAKNYVWRMKSNICRYNLSGTSGGTGSSRKSIGSPSPATGLSSFVMGPNFMCHKTPVQRLSTDKTLLNTKISSMVALGSTNILDGFMWAWRTLSPNTPYADAKAYNWTDVQYKNKKIIIVMTDGDNQWYAQDESNSKLNPNLSIYSPNGFYANNRLGAGITNMSTAEALMNSKTQQACNNARTKKNAQNEDAITIYTIGYSTPSRPISTNGKTLLENCASVVNGQRLYYPVKNASELTKVFADIAADLSKLKLSK